MLLRNLFLAGFLTAISGLSVGLAHAAEKAVPWPENAFAPLTEERIAALPKDEQPAWRQYWQTSRDVAARVKPATEPEFSPTAPLKVPLKGASHAKGLKENASPEWYATDEARQLADRVVEYQAATGGWTKSNDYSVAPVPKSKIDYWSYGTLDNNATVLELRFLANVEAQAPNDGRAEAWRASFLRGLEYLFNAQYPNGGFPQIYPLAGGYHDAITYNDGAMIRALELLSDVAVGKALYAFVPEKQRAEAAERVERGIQCILKSQIVEPSGRPTVWCQQHDMLTLKPCAARNFEPISATTAESVGIVRFLMRQPDAQAKYSEVIADAVKWFQAVALHDRAWDRRSNPTKLIHAPGAPLLWARLYEIGTDKPIFGDRDRTVHYEVSEISIERQKGYSWYSEYAQTILTEYPKWLGKQSASPRADKHHSK
ncbi:MAG: pectate lyase [Nibricoccus sp.]